MYGEFVYRVLAYKDGDTYRALAQKSTAPYMGGQWYKLRSQLDGPKIAVFLDGHKDLEATDETFANGGIVLCSWSCSDTKFRKLGKPAAD